MKKILLIIFACLSIQAYPQKRVIDATSLLGLDTLYSNLNYILTKHKGDLLYAPLGSSWPGMGTDHIHAAYGDHLHTGVYATFDSIPFKKINHRIKLRTSLDTIALTSSTPTEKIDATGYKIKADRFIGQYLEFDNTRKQFIQVHPSYVKMYLDNGVDGSEQIGLGVGNDFGVVLGTPRDGWKVGREIGIAGDTVLYMRADCGHQLGIGTDGTYFYPLRVLVTQRLWVTAMDDASIPDSLLGIGDGGLVVRFKANVSDWNEAHGWGNWASGTLYPKRADSNQNKPYGYITYKFYYDHMTPAITQYWGYNMDQSTLYPLGKRSITLDAASQYKFSNGKSYTQTGDSTALLLYGRTEIDGQAKIDTILKSISTTPYLVSDSAGFLRYILSLPQTFIDHLTDSLLNKYTKSQADAKFALLGHNHSGVYEPVISKSTGYLKWTGSAWGWANETYSLSSHNHTGVYEPAFGIASWAGSSNVTTLGTIITGVWHGTSIGTGYTDAKCTATWPNSYSADQNLSTTSSPTFVTVSHTTIPATNSSATGLIETDTANVTMGIGDVVFIGGTNGDRMVLCKADAIANCPYAIAICTGSVSAGSVGTYLTQGDLRNDSWTWTKGALIYVSTTGTTGNTLTQTAPSGANNVIMPIGVAKTAHVIKFSGNLKSVEHL